MTSMHVVLRGLLLAILAIIPIGAGAADDGYWGRKLADPPTNFIFGYGSLINSPSRNSTATAPIPAIPVRVSAALGFIRTWNDRSGSGFTALGLRKPVPGEAARTINGVLYPVEGDDMKKFDEREAGYKRVEVPFENIQAVGWQPLPTSGHIWVYVPVPKGGGEPGVGLPKPDAEFPLVESYVDIVVEGGLEYSPDFALEILETTDGWSEFWLNDRPLARRPWVYDRSAAAVDAIIKKSSTALPFLKDRMFPEDYAAKRLTPAAAK